MTYWTTKRKESELSFISDASPFFNKLELKEEEGTSYLGRVFVKEVSERKILELEARKWKDSHVINVQMDGYYRGKNLRKVLAVFSPSEKTLKSHVSNSLNRFHHIDILPNDVKVEHCKVTKLFKYTY
jgi:hypothetical protein